MTKRKKSMPPCDANAAPTYVIEMTPPGRAAVAVVLVAGPAATATVSKYFHAASGRPLAGAAIDRIAVGRWADEAGEELIICRRSEDRIEIHCHGGAAAVRGVIDDLVTDGCQRITWQDWLASSASDPLVAEAHIALAGAITARTAGILLDQLNGALTSAVRDVVEAINQANWPLAETTTDAMLRHRDVGLHLTRPWRVVFAGPPNVGKSSLINALAGYERAIVSPTPGTTRDVVTVTTAVDGWPVELADTAGLRSTQDTLEAAGVELARTALAGADLVVFVQDATQSTSLDEFASEELPSRMIHVRNKIDLIKTPAGQQSEFTSSSALAVSALTNVGIPQLARTIALALVPDPPALGTAVPFTARQIEVLALARNAMERRHAAAAIESLQSLLPQNATTATTD